MLNIIHWDTHTHMCHFFLCVIFHSNSYSIVVVFFLDLLFNPWEIWDMDSSSSSSHDDANLTERRAIFEQVEYDDTFWCTSLTEYVCVFYLHPFVIMRANGCRLKLILWWIIDTCDMLCVCNFRAWHRETRDNLIVSR